MRIRRSLVRCFPILLSIALSVAACATGGNRNPSQADPPESAILIALGHDSKTHPLQGFAEKVQRELHRPVVTYRQFESAHYTEESGAWWDRLPFEETTAVVERAIRRAVALYPRGKVIAFNLDGFDPRGLCGPDGREVRSYTNFEVRLLLRESRLYSATRWYREGEEMSSEDAKEFWAGAVWICG